MQSKKLLQAILLTVAILFFKTGFSVTTAGFTTVQQAGCSPFIILLNDTTKSNHTLVARKWVITKASGDTVYNTNTNQSTVGATLVDSGYYTVSLYVCNRLGECDYVSKSNYLYVKALPKLNFSISPMSGCPPFKVDFNCNSSAGCGTLDTIVVDFKNGEVKNFSSCTAFSTIYQNSGSYFPTFYLKNSCGCFIDSTYATPIVATAKPKAAFTANGSTQSCSAPFPVTLEAQQQGSAVRYQWFVNNVLKQNSKVTSFTQSYTGGSYNIKLVTLDSLSGCTDTLVKNNYINAGNPPTPSFSASSTTGCAPMTVTLKNTTTGAPNNLKWTIADSAGNILITRNGNLNVYDSIKYTFNNIGKYSVCLVATFPGGCDDTLCVSNYITVGTLPAAGFTASDTTTCNIPANVTFSPSSNCIGCTYAWDFSGTGTAAGATPATSTQKNPTITWNAAGNKRAQLTITDANGCSAVINKTNYVKIAPLDARMAISNKSGCAPLTTDFSDSTVSSSPVSNVKWIFPGGTPSTATGRSIPSVTYNNPGTYSVTMIVTTVSGCIDTFVAKDTIRVGVVPTGNFTVNPSTVCYESLPNIMTFNGTQHDTLLWTLGDGGKVTMLKDTLNYIYKDLGVYTPCVIASDRGCRSQPICVIDAVNILGPAAKYTDIAVCNTANTVTYSNQSVQATSFFWQFCDGTTSTDSAPTRTYSRCDTCTVKLTAYNSVTGCTHFKSTKTIIPCAAAEFTYSDSVVCVGQPVTFTNVNPFGAASNSKWDINTANGIVYNINGHTISQSYTAPGYYSVSLLSYKAGGCRDTISKTNIIKVVKPTAASIISDTVFCVPQIITVRDASSSVYSTITNYSWNFGDTTSINYAGANQQHTFTTVGKYPIKLTVTDNYGCKDSVSTLVVSNHIVAGFTFDDSTCAGKANTFTNTSTGLNQSYRWYFTGGTPNVSTNRHVNVSYANEGDYDVMLTVMDNSGLCRDTLRSKIHVYDPIADYSASQTYATCADPPLLVQFTDKSKNDIVSYSWNFGDGTPNSTQQNPSHYYSNAGIYPVTLTVTSGNGCTSVISKDSIKIDGPYATMTFSPKPGICPCDSVEFTLSTVNCKQAVLLDGQNSPFYFNNISPVGTFANPTILKKKVQFCTSGMANSQALISDGLGCNILLQPVPVIIDTPSVYFKVNNPGVCSAGSVCFTDSTIFVTQGTFGTKWVWHFGDGGTDTVLNPCHQYNAAGDYKVRLEVYNNLGCSNFFERTIHINGTPKIQIAANDSAGCTPQTIQFTDLSKVDTTTTKKSFSWNFGGQGTSTVQNPSFNFTTPGNYFVKLTLTDNAGCASTDSLAISIHALPIANAGKDTTVCFGTSAQLNGSGAQSYNWSPAASLNNASASAPVASPVSDQNYILTVTDQYGCTGTDTVKVQVAKVIASFTTNSSCFPDPITFTSNGSNTHGTILTYSYDFGDGDAATGASNTHNYASFGTYQASLTVLDNNGCMDDTIKTVAVRVRPIAAFTADTVCNGNATHFADATVMSGANVTSRKWDFGVAGNADTSSLANPTFTYSAAGTYKVKLTITNDAGCSDDTTMTILVQSAPTANFTAAPVCFGTATTFTSTSANGSNSIVSNVWDFDAAVSGADTSTSLGSASFVYPTAGTRNATLTVFDARGCSAKATKAVVVYSLPVAQFTDSNACTNSTIAFVSTSISGTNAISNYKWNFNAGTPSSTTASSTKVSGINTPGTYTASLIVSDNKGCADTATGTFRVFNGPQADIMVDDSTICRNICVTASSIVLLGDTNISSYSWDMDANGTIEFSVANPSCYTYPAAGNKTIRLNIKDANGCSATATHSMLVNDVPSADFSWTTVCAKSSMPLSNTSQAGSAPLASCLWVLPAGITDTKCNTSFAFPAGGKYKVSLIVSDAIGCADTATKDVSVDAPTQVAVVGNDTTICYGETLPYSVSGTFTEVVWSPATFLDDPNSASVNITPRNDVKYVVTAKNGTCKSASDSFNISVIQPIPLEVSSAPASILLGLNTNITSTIGGKIDSITWSPTEGLSCRTCDNPTATPQATTTYYATIYYSKNGIICTQTDSTTVTVFNSCDESVIYVPNSFTPNNDGMNDGFTIRGLGISKVKSFSIFDRWGKLVFQADNAAVNSAAATWDGKDMNGKELNPAVFVYMYQIICTDGDVLSGKGNVTLIK